MKHSARLAAALSMVLVLAGRSFSQDPPNPVSPRSDDKPAPTTIVGGWRADSVSITSADGKRKTISGKDGRLSLIISEKLFTLRAADNVLTDMSYTVDAKQDPCTIELKSPDGGMLGIYKLDGDRLQIALNDTSQGRPKDIRQESSGLGLDLVQYEGAPLWIVDADGDNQRPFYSSPEYAHCGGPAWSPDGGKVAFDYIREFFGESFVNSRIMVVDATGGHPKEIGHGVIPSWSRDGKKIAFSSYEAPHSGACIMDADGSDVQSIDPNGWGIAWSPKPDEVAYIEGANLCLYDLKTQQRRQLLGTRYRNIVFGFTWSPDGQWICFCGELEQGKEIAVVHRDGEEKGFRVLASTRTTQGLRGLDSFLAWEPKEGKRVLATLLNVDNPHRQLFFLDAEGKVPPERFAGQDPKRSVQAPAWSPDGKRIIYSLRPTKRSGP